MKIKKSHFKKIIKTSLNKNLINESPAFSSLILKNFLNKKKQDILALHKKAFDLAIEKFDLDPHRDAFRHILGYGFLVQYLNSMTIGKMIGEFIELKGAINSYLSGGPFDSGWAMDSANNNIGFDLGKKYKTQEAIIERAYQIVTSGNFFIDDGKTLFKNSDKSVYPPKPKHGKYNKENFEFQKQQYK